MRVTATQSRTGQSAEAVTDRILIVSGDPETVLVLSLILVELGEVRVVAAFDEAIAALYEFEPDMVLVDLRMHVPQVLDLVRSLRSPVEVFLPVLILCEESTKSTRDTALLLGASDFLNRPLDRTEVVVRARNLLLTRRLYLDLMGLTDAEDEPPIR